MGGETCLRRAAGPVLTAPASEKRAGAARVHLGAGLLKYRHGERRGSSTRSCTAGRVAAQRGPAPVSRRSVVVFVIMAAQFDQRHVAIVAEADLG